MSQIVHYRQYWMATLKDRHLCEKCGELATEALYFENEPGSIIKVSWSCRIHTTIY